MTADDYSDNDDDRDSDYVDDNGDAKHDETLKSYCSEIQHRFIPAVHIQHTFLS